MEKKVKVAVGSESVLSLPFIYLILFFFFGTLWQSHMVAKLTLPIWPPSGWSLPPPGPPAELAHLGKSVFGAGGPV